MTDKEFADLLLQNVGKACPSGTEDDVRAFALRYAKLMEFDGNFDHALHQVLITITTRMSEGVSIVEPSAIHDEGWVRRRQIEYVYADSYETYLGRTGWSPHMVQSLRDVGGRLLELLQDPLSQGEWDRRGLVIGHVQSGKTASYLDLVCRAADAGYKFIIVIAGIHNLLRTQTQERVEAGFIGRSSDPQHQLARIGVGELASEFPHPAALTTVHRDFNAATAAASGWQIDDFSKPIVVVIKKRVATLKRLYAWLYRLNAQGGRIRDVPMLMIDDEADNASINTSKEDDDPTATNRNIRKILRLFAKSCYVGYTATPFANIFINPEAFDDEAYEELFPRDFIYSLDPPTSYFGPDKVFVEDESSDRVLRQVDDCEAVIPVSHKKELTPPYLPDSLLEAIDVFFLARVIRNLRGQSETHASMMINVSRFVNVQRHLKTEVSAYVDKVRQAVSAHGALPVADALRDPVMARLKRAFDAEFAATGCAWGDVMNSLRRVVDAAKVVVINSNSDERLAYGNTAAGEDGRTILAVGGLSLSRGLTIEGLTVSYIHRNTSMYDTLMQMGRWFGYRPGYEDLCRVYLPERSIAWYRHIAEKTEELRDQIRRMGRLGQTPREFGLYVGSHPDALVITAANKMRHGKPVTLEIDFGGQLVESHFLPLDPEVNRRNEALVAEFWERGFGATVQETSKGWFVPNAPTAEIIAFLNRFETCPGKMKGEFDLAKDYLHELSDLYPHCDVLLISRKENDESGPERRLGYQSRGKDDIEQSGPVWRTRKDRVASRGDEKLGLNADQVRLAHEFAERDHPGNPRWKDKLSDTHFREVRNKPLLMVHRLALGPLGVKAMAIGVSFPFLSQGRTVTAVANKVWLEQQGVLFELDADDEEDLDD